MGEFAVGLNSGPNAFQVRVHDDDGGLPGKELEQVTIINQMPQFGPVHPPVVVDFGGATLLSPGQYWISMSAPTGTSAAWSRNSIGDLGPRAFQINNGFWELGEERSQRSVFRLHGTLVPAPSAIWLLALLVCAPCVRRRVRGGASNV
jgi:hypothetical protein